LIFESSAIWRGSSPWCDTPWKPDVGASLSGYVRPVRSRAPKSRVPTRVMSAWKASARSLNCSLMLSRRTSAARDGHAESRREPSSTPSSRSAGRRRFRGRSACSRPSRARSDAADLAAQVRQTAVERIEDAVVALAPRRTLLDGTAVAEHPLEDHLRVQLHWQRLRRGRPRDRVGVACSFSPRRSCSSSTRDPRRPAASTAAGCRRRSAGAMI